MIYKQFRALSLLLLTMLVVLSSNVMANSLESLRVWPSPDETRVVIDLKTEVEYSFFSLSSPYRLVVDLKKTVIHTKLPINVKDSKILTKIRKSTPPEKGTYRLVFELKKQASANLFKLKPTPGGEYGHRLVIDIPHETATKSSATALSQQTKVNKDASQLAGTADIIVAIDAGHGGEDPGSIGPTRKYEKHATLSISRKVAQQLNSVPGIKAVMTRSGDYFVNLNKRSSIARRNKAHLLISVHADSFRSPQPRGGSVFVLNMSRANSEIARWVETKEQQSELLGGAGEVLSKTNTDKNVSQTLLDLQFSHSQKEGFKVATHILKEMGKVTRLHKKDPVHASLAVLKSPDIPSVLVETGFLSNPTEEKLLFQRTHQDKLARALAKAVVKYFEVNPPEGTLFAKRKHATKHKVAKGESLSLIASKYGVTTQSLMKANSLKKTGLAIGQVLIIPADRAPVVVKKPVNPVETKVVTHVVKAGEYLGKLATKYKVTVASIKAQNKLKRETLWIGQKLKITVKLKDLPIRKHKVKRGEFLSKIAGNYDVTVNSIRKANKLRSDKLAVGQILVIPNR